MKNQVITTMKLIMAVARNFCYQYAVNLLATEKFYVKPWPGDTANDGYTQIIIGVTAYGSLYRISQYYYLKGDLQREKFWIAYYGDAANRLLIEIGGDRYCIFNPARKELYLEYYVNNDKVAELYKEL